MNRPGPLVYLFGNPVSAFALVIGALWLAYQWWVGQASLTYVLIIGFAAIYASGAYERLASYQTWKREWDAMSGRPARASIARRILQSRWLRALVGVPLWCVMALGALKLGRDPGMQIPVAMFWIGTAIIVLHPVYRLIRQRLTRPKPFKDVPVELCLRVPKRSPAIGSAVISLPNYCNDLFAS